MKKRIMQFLFIIGAVYLIMILFLYFYQSKLIFFPIMLNENNPLIKKFEKCEISVQSDNNNLYGWLINPGKSKICFYYGGNAEEVSHNLDDFEKLDEFSFVLMNYRGYGKSEGKPGEKELYEDALCVYDHILSNSNMEINEIVLFGRSLGTAIATYIGSKRKADKLILVTPFDSIEKVASKQFPIFPVSLLLMHPFDSIKNIENNKIPTLVLIAENDEVIPFNNTQELVNKLGNYCKTINIKNAGHNNIQHFPKYWDAILEFLMGE